PQRPKDITAAGPSAVHFICTAAGEAPSFLNYGAAGRSCQTAMTATRSVRTSPLRVLQVIRPAAGGMRKHLSLLCEGLAGHGIAVTVAAPPGFTLEMSARPPIVPVEITGRPGASADLRAVAEVERVALDVHLIHAHGMRAAWIAGFAARRLGVPFLWTAHNLAPGARIFPRYLF